jgi:hypothetical protein
MLVAGPYGTPKPEGRRRKPRQTFPQSSESREVFAERERLNLYHLAGIHAALKYLCGLATAAFLTAAAYGLLIWLL